MENGNKRLENTKTAINLFYDLKKTYSKEFKHLRNAKIEFRNIKRSFGYCRVNHTWGEVEKIVLSNDLVNKGDIEEVKETLLHEFGHALDMNKSRHGQGWIEMCKMIGLENPTRTATRTYEIDFKYNIYCSECGQLVAKRHRVTNALRRRYTSKCCHAKLKVVENA